MDENRWLRITFDTAAAVQAESSLRSGYVQLKDVSVLSEAEAAAVSGNASLRKDSAGHAIPVCSIEEADSTLTETQKATETITAPATVTAAMASATSIKLTWSTVSNAASYKIYRSTTQTGGYTLVKTITGDDTTSWTNTGLTSGTTYYYTLKAYAESGEVSAYSGKASAAPSVPVSADELTAIAIPIISDNEGTYTSVNPKDGTSFSIGMLQWNATYGRALALVRKIIALDADGARTLLGDTLYEEAMNSSTDWAKRTLSSSEETAFAKFLNSSSSRTAQDEQAIIDVKSYINVGKNLGLVDEGALVYYADLYNQNPSAANTIAKAAKSSAGSWEAVTVEEMYTAALANSTLGTSAGFGSRRTNTYNAVKAQFPDEAVLVTSISLSATTLTVGVDRNNESYPVTATVSPSNATNQAITWSSSNTSVVTVDASTGLLTGVSAGTATITAKASDGSGVTATCKVYVVAQPVIKINSTTVTAGALTTHSVSDALTVSWSGTNATSYKYKIITMTEAPEDNENQGTTATVETVVNQSTASTTTSYTITASELAAYAENASYLKIWVQALNTNGSSHGRDCWIGVELEPEETATIGTLKFVDEDGDKIDNGDVLDHYLEDGSLTISWDCDNWSYFKVKAILVKDYPSGTSQTAISTLKSDSSKYYDDSITFTASQLSDGAYLKIAVTGYDSAGNASNTPWIGYMLIPEADVLSTPSVSPATGGMADSTEYTITVVTPVNMYAVGIGYYTNDLLDTGTYSVSTVYTEDDDEVTITKSNTQWTWEITRQFSHLGESTDTIRHTHVIVFNDSSTSKPSYGVSAKTNDFECAAETSGNSSYKTYQNRIVSRAKEYMYSAENYYLAEGMAYYTHGSTVKLIPAYWYLHGVPYSGYTGECRKTLETYLSYTLAEKSLYDTYTYNGNTRTGSIYGLECTGFCLDCWNEVGSYSMSGGFTDTVKSTAYRYSLTAQSDLQIAQPGDVLRNSGHVMLVISNDTSAEQMVIIEQTAANGTTLDCECSGCEQNIVTTLGTRMKTYDYSSLYPSYPQLFRHEDCMGPGYSTGWSAPGTY